MPFKLKWYASNVKAAFKKEEKEGLLRVGLRVRSQVRRNITLNGQNDTKFMWNSVYVATPDKTTDIPPDDNILPDHRALLDHVAVFRRFGCADQFVGQVRVAGCNDHIDATAAVSAENQLPAANIEL